MKEPLILYSYEIEAVRSASDKIAEEKKAYHSAFDGDDVYKHIADKLCLNLDALRVLSGVNCDAFEIIILPNPILPSREIESFWAEVENESYDDYEDNSYLWEEWEIYCQARREGMA